jgi:hypothetical protein
MGPARYASELDQRCRPLLKAANAVNPGLEFGAFHTAQRTIQSYAAMHMLRMPLMA